MDPICELIQNCQSLDFSIAYSCEAWESLNLNVLVQFADAINRRKSMTIGICSKAANYLDPRYKGRKLSAENIEEVEVFLINALSEEGLEYLQHYKNSTNFFDILEKKKMSSSILYWKCASSSLKHRELANIALKLITIPASSAEVDECFPIGNLFTGHYVTD